MLFLRSLVFNVVFYVNLIVQMVVQTPFFFFLSRDGGWGVVKRWCKSCAWWQNLIIGTTQEIRGLENLPEGGFIVAAKHQSMWDTYTLVPLFKDPAFILKRELMWIPFFGWFAAKQDSIPVNRGARSKALRDMTQAAREAIADDRQIVIYPEGTRRPAGAEPKYKYGIAHMYRDMNVRVVPIAVNSGLFWPRRKFMRYPGNVVVEILKPIEPGLSVEEFQKQLTEIIESKCDELLLEAHEQHPDLPLNPEAEKRIAELRASKKA